MSATIDVSMNVAVQYSHRFPSIPDNRAGANERAGFMDAPDINAKKKISKPTIPSIASQPKPFNPLYKQLPR